MSVTALPAGQAAVRSPLRRLWRFHPWLALALYLVGALVMQYRMLGHMSSGCACLGYDPTQYMWANVWWPHALLHGLNPFWSHLLWAPWGIDMASNTTTPVPALVGAPLTWLAGPVVTYNVEMLLMPVLSGFCAYRLCLYLTRRPGPAIVGGWLFAFCSYAVTQQMGHLHLLVMFPAPLAVLLTLKRLDGAISVRRYVIWLAVLLIVELGSGTEVLLTMTLAGAVAWIFGALLSPPERRRQILALIGPIVCAYLAMAVICSPFIYYALKGPPLAVGWGISADLLSFVIPTLATWLGGHWFLSISGHYRAGVVETGTYLGLPLLVLVVWYLIEARRLRGTWILAATTIVLALWSLGAHLMVDGHVLVPLPYRLLEHVPLLDQILPVRVGAYVELGCAIFAALWLARPSPHRWLQWGRWLLVLVTAAFLVPQFTASEYDGQISVPVFFKTSAYRRYLRPGEVVLPIPFGPSGPSLVWQAETGMYFRLASGDFTTPASYISEPATLELLGGAPLPTSTATLAAQLRQLLVTHGVGAVAVQAGAGGPWTAALAALGAKPVTVDGIQLYSLSGVLPARR